MFSPRYYEATERQGNGEGLYEFKPLHNESLLYSEIKKVEKLEGKHSGQYLLTYESRFNDTPSHGIEPKLTVLVELSENSDFVNFQVVLN